MLGVAALSALVLMVPGIPTSVPAGEGPSPAPIVADAGASSATGDVLVHPVDGDFATGGVISTRGAVTPSSAAHLSVSRGVQAPAAIDPKGCVPRWRCG